MVLWLLLCLFLLRSSASVVTSARPWPPIFHALLSQNRSNSLSRVDLYYDFPHGRNLNIIQPQDYPDTALFDNELANGTTFYYHMQRTGSAQWTPVPGSTCKIIQMGVGLVKPDFLSDAEFVEEDGDLLEFRKELMDNGKYFITYWENKTSGFPVKWQFFDGASFDVLAWNEGDMADEKLWSIPEGLCNGANAVM